MRLMARIASHAARVLGGDHLWKPCGLGRIFFVAPAAEVGDVGQLGDVGGGIFGVLRQRTVASFAGDVRVLAGGAGFGLVIVAQDALVLARVSDGALVDFIQRGGSIVAVLAEGLGDN